MGYRVIMRACVAAAAAFVVWNILGGCQNGLITPSEESEKAVELCVEPVVGSLVETSRSIFSQGERTVSEVALHIYCNGVLEGAYHSTGQAIRHTFRTGQTYTIYAAANMGRIEGDIRDCIYSHEGTSEFNSGGGFPMAGQTTLTVTATTSSIVVELVRLVARLRLRVDSSSLSGSCSVNSVTLHQEAAEMAIFGGSNCASRVIADADRASQSDLDALNSGSAASFYMLENMQGTLLPANSDPWSKVPTSIPAAQGVCTYCEVGCDITSGTGTTHATYRMYLGSDSTTNFDVERNTSYDLTLIPTDSGLEVDGNWKITVLRDGPVPLELSWSRQLQLIAQSAEVRVSGAGYREVSAVGDGSVLRVMGTRTASDGSTYIKVGAIGKGTGALQIMLDGEPAQAVNITVEAPVLYLERYGTEKPRYMLRIDGAATGFTYGYHDQINNCEYVDYDTSLYAELLVPISGSSDYPQFIRTDTQRRELSIYQLYDAASDESLDSNIDFQILVPSELFCNFNISAPCRDILPAEGEIWLLNPFRMASSELGDYVNYTLLDGTNDFNTTLDLPLAMSEEYDDPEPFDIELAFDYAPAAIWAYNIDSWGPEGISVTIYTEDSGAVPCGVGTARMAIRHNGTFRSPAATFTLRQHMGIVGLVRRTSSEALTVSLGMYHEQMVCRTPNADLGGFGCSIWFREPNSGTYQTPPAVVRSTYTEAFFKSNVAFDLKWSEGGLDTVLQDFPATTNGYMIYHRKGWL